MILEVEEGVSDIYVNLLKSELLSIKPFVKRDITIRVTRRLSREEREKLLSSLKAMFPELEDSELEEIFEEVLRKRGQLLYRNGDEFVILYNHSNVDAMKWDVVQILIDANIEFSSLKERRGNVNPYIDSTTKTLALIIREYLALITYSKLHKKKELIDIAASIIKQDYLIRPNDPFIVLHKKVLEAIKKNYDNLPFPLTDPLPVLRFIAKLLQNYTDYNVDVRVKGNDVLKVELNVREKETEKKLFSTTM